MESRGHGAGAPGLRLPACEDFGDNHGLSLSLLLEGSCSEVESGSSRTSGPGTQPLRVSSCSRVSYCMIFGHAEKYQISGTSQE